LGSYFFNCAVQLGGKLNGGGHGDMESAVPFSDAHDPGDDYRTNVQ
jgi:hypothetical protein